jgi:hypothetical protein
VHRIVANDPDIAPILRYRIDPNSSEARNEEGTLIRIQEYDYLAALELNAVDGLLRVIKLLDREIVETIRLGLVVEDLAAVKGIQIASGNYLNFKTSLRSSNKLYSKAHSMATSWVVKDNFYCK